MFVHKNHIYTIFEKLIFQSLWLAALEQIQTLPKHDCGFFTITIISGLQKTLLQTDILPLLTEEINRAKTYILVIRYSSSYRVGNVSVIPQKKECILIPKL